MKTCRNFHLAKSIDDALAAIIQAEGEIAVLAGGTDLLLDIQQGRHPQVDMLVDISGIPEMGILEEARGYIYIGASVTHKQIIGSKLLQDNAQCVVEGCGLIGGPQVRNVATIGGNVSHALPAGDGTISLLALNTQVEIASIEGRRWEPLIDIFTGPGKVTFNREKELVTRFRFKKPTDFEGTAFHRVMRPQGVAIAILNMAAWVKLDDAENLIDVRVACGPAGPRPFRGYETEAFLRDKSLDDAVLLEAARVLDEEVNFRTSRHRATEEYRHKLLPVLLKQVLQLAVFRAKREGVQDD
jgi:CO/xanthine dehydrogenase FAD-binding subunit